MAWPKEEDEMCMCSECIAEQQLDRDDGPDYFDLTTWAEIREKERQDETREILNALRAEDEARNFPPFPVVEFTEAEEDAMADRDHDIRRERWLMDDGNGNWRY